MFLPSIITYTGHSGSGKSSSLIRQLLKENISQPCFGFITVRRMNHGQLSFCPLTAEAFGPHLKQLKNIQEKHLQQAIDQFLGPRPLEKVPLQTHPRHSAQNQQPGPPSCVLPLEQLKALILDQLKQAKQQDAVLILDEIGGLELLDDDWFNQFMPFLDEKLQGFWVFKSQAQLFKQANRRGLAPSQLELLAKRHDELHAHLKSLGPVIDLNAKESTAAFLAAQKEEA